MVFRVSQKVIDWRHSKNQTVINNFTTHMSETMGDSFVVTLH